MPPIHLQDVLVYNFIFYIILVEFSLSMSQYMTDPSGREVKRVGLRRFACWKCRFESLRRHGCLSLVSVVCCEVEVSAKGWSLVQRIPTECDVSGCDREASTKRRPWPTMGCWVIWKKSLNTWYMRLHKYQARPVRVGFVVYNVALKLTFPWVLRFQLSAPFHQCSIILENDCVVKQHTSPFS